MKRLALQLTEYGAVLRFEDGTTHPPAVELAPIDLLWLARTAREAARLHGAESHDGTVIVNLGAPNAADGTLSSIAKERCEQTLLTYQSLPGTRVLLCGGWGLHFNTAPEPHWHYARAYLQARGMSAAAFVEGVASANTYEEARLCRPIVERYGFSKMLVVTSDFHVVRARYHFQQAFPDVAVEVVAAPTILSVSALQQLLQHEQVALARTAREAARLHGAELRSEVADGE